MINNEAKVAAVFYFWHCSNRGNMYPGNPVNFFFQQWSEAPFGLCHKYLDPPLMDPTLMLLLRWG